MYQREQIKHLKKWTAEPRHFILFILGPRQVGKTTLATQLTAFVNYPFHYVAADNVTGPGDIWLRQQWDIARIKSQKQKKRKFLLIIDEIQKIQNWSEVVKAEWDRDSRDKNHIKVLLLGSSRLLLQQGMSESLMGRFETIHLPHWSFPEMRKAFKLSLNEFIWYGGYPGAMHLRSDEKRVFEYVRESLIEPTIAKDILMMTRVDKPALLKNFFEIGSLYSGQILSLTKILGQLHDSGNTTTLTHYLELLKTAGLLRSISKYSRNILRKRASIPKFQVYNNALISALSGKTFDEVYTRKEKWGRWVESAIGAHLINAETHSDVKVYYWRHANDEVDFVLEKQEQIIGIEVKSGLSKPGREMKTFATEFNPAKLILVGEDGMAVEEFLNTDPQSLF